MKTSVSSTRSTRLRVLLLAIALVPVSVLASLATVDLAGQSRNATATMGALEPYNQSTAPAVPQGIYLTAQRIVF